MDEKFELRKSADNQFFFTLRAGNGEPILSSETYVTKSSAENGITAVKTNAPDDTRYERKIVVNNQPYFVLKAVNEEPIGRSETYSSTSAMEIGIAAVKSTAPSARTEDLT